MRLDGPGDQSVPVAFPVAGVSRFLGRVEPQPGVAGVDHHFEESDSVVVFAAASTLAEEGVELVVGHDSRLRRHLLISFVSLESSAEITSDGTNADFKLSSSLREREKEFSPFFLSFLLA